VDASPWGQALVTWDYFTQWSTALTQAGIPRTKLYDHGTVTPPEMGTSALGDPNYMWQEYGVTNAIGGLTNYGSPGIFGWQHYWSGVYWTPWGIAEGTNTTLDGQTSPLSWQQYFDNVFAFGGMMINVFGVFNNEGYGVATESLEAQAAYRTFLGGSPYSWAWDRNADSFAHGSGWGTGDGGWYEPVGSPVWSNVTYGPYEYLGPGDYEAIFTIRTGGCKNWLADTNYVYVDVATSYGASIKASATMNGKSFRGEWVDTEIHVPFHSDGEGTFEYRVYMTAENADIAHIRTRIAQR
jgi:hypothetical protein